MADTAINPCSSAVVWFVAALALSACGESAAPGKAVTAPQAMPDMPEFGGPVSVLPPPPPADARVVDLGRFLFSDLRLSRDGSVSCASCHDLHNGGDDGRRVSVGVGGREGLVNAPTVFNSGLNVAQFWDGRARSLEEQISETLQNPREMGSNLDALERRLNADVPLARRFANVFEDGVTEANVVAALAVYVRSLMTPNAPFDRYLSGDREAVSDEVVEGYALFRSLGCVSCHQGRNIGGNLFQRLGVMGDYFADRGDLTKADYGRYNVTGREEDRFKFKVPSLRNVARTAPYFHDGSAASLEEAVEVMVRYQLGRNVTEVQVDRLLAFLDSLSGELEEPLP